jgi:hypothetical protein
MMKSLAVLAMSGMLAVPAFAATQTFTDVPVVDVACSHKVMSNPDSHTRACTIQCAKSGYGIIENGKFLKLDEQGNKEILSQLKASHEKDHLRVDATGNVENGVLQVSSIKLR